jgi:predicted transcriptional regulator
MGIVDDEMLQEEINRNGVREIREVELHIPVSSVGRALGDLNVPESLRKVIAADAIENGRESAVRLGKSFGISSSSVSAYSNGSTSTASYNDRDKGLQNHNREVKEKIAGKARRRLHWSLNEITQDKLKEASLKTLSQVSKDMSVIIKQMEPDPASEIQKNTNVQVVLFAPKTLTEEDFPSIRVNE